MKELNLVMENMKIDIIKLKQPLRKVGKHWGVVALTEKNH